MKVLICKLRDSTYEKLKVWRTKLGLEEKDWGDFFDYITREVHFWEPLTETLTRRTLEKLLPLWCENFAINLQKIRDGKALNDLVGYGKNKPAIVVGAGPSLYKNRHLQLLAKSDFDGIVLISDRVLIDSLKSGVTPEKFDIIVGTVDGNRDLIWQHYDDPIVDKYGDRLKAVFASTAAPNAAERAEKAGIEIYWYNPPLDDWRKNESLTRLMGMMTKTEKRPKGIGVLRSGGQVGCGLNIMAHAVLGCKKTALIGIDCGYLPETPIEKTDYYKQLLSMAKGNINEVKKYFKKIYNPYFKCECLVDFMFDSYRDIWMETIRALPPDHVVYNCTEGGCLFGKDIPCIRFEDFLNHYRNDLSRYVLKAE